MEAVVMKWQSLAGRVSAWLAERQRKRSPRQLRVQETLPLGEKRQLLLVACGRRRLLVGASVNNMTLIAELDASSGERGDGSE